MWSRPRSQCGLLVLVGVALPVVRTKLGKSAGFDGAPTLVVTTRAKEINPLDMNFTHSHHPSRRRWSLLQDLPAAERPLGPRSRHL